MNIERQSIVDKIIEILLATPDHDRAIIINEIYSNPFFCCECGYGSKERPNVRCQCWNDE